MSNFYDIDGRPIGFAEWSEKFEDFSYRRIAWTEAGPGIEVSTVWLGLDPRHRSGPPLIFETMVFGGEEDQSCRRYSTLEQAKAGHEVMVRMVTAKQEDDQS